jgi:hypothetical protein
MWLIRNGVAEDLAWSLGRAERLARVVVFAEFEGAEFDWRRMAWKERKD